MSVPVEVGPKAQSQTLIPGSAEWLSTLLTSRGLFCSHFPRYNVDDSPPQYPSRLGFFHTSSSETRISFLETKQLCKDCLQSAVPDGFNYWSVFATIRDTKGKLPSAHLPMSRWLDITPSPGSDPRMFQAGTEEGFPKSLSRGRTIASRLTTPPKIIPIAGATGAKKAWQWLKDQHKPFYIDQLHLSKDWSSLSQKAAERDSLIAEKSEKSRKRPSSLKKEGRLSEVIDTKSMLGGQAGESSKPTKPKKSSLSKKSKTATEVINRSAIDSEHTKAFEPLTKSAPSKTKITANTKADLLVIDTHGEIQTGKISPKETKKGNKAGKVEERKLNSTFAYTKNWSRHDPIPFDSPIKTVKLSDYKRQAAAIDPKAARTDPLLKPLLKKSKHVKDSADFSGPGSSPKTPGAASFLKRANQKKQSAPMSTSQFIKSISDAASGKASSKTKPGKAILRPTRPESVLSTKAKLSASLHSRDRSSGVKPLQTKVGKPSGSDSLKAKFDKALGHNTLKGKHSGSAHGDKTNRVSIGNPFGGGSSSTSGPKIIIPQALALGNSTQQNSESHADGGVTGTTGAAVAGALGLAAGMMLGSEVNSTPYSPESEPSSPSNHHHDHYHDHHPFSESSRSSSPVSSINNSGLPSPIEPVESSGSSGETNSDDDSDSGEEQPSGDESSGPEVHHSSDEDDSYLIGDEDHQISEDESSDGNEYAYQISDDESSDGNEYAHQISDDESSDGNEDAQISDDASSDGNEDAQISDDESSDGNEDAHQISDDDGGENRSDDDDDWRGEVLGGYDSDSD